MARETDTSLSFVAPAFLSWTTSRPKPATVVPTVTSALCPAVTLLCTTLADTPADVIEAVVSQRSSHPWCYMNTLSSFMMIYLTTYLWPCRSLVYDRLGHCRFFTSHKQGDRYLSLYKRALYTHKSCFPKNLYFSCYSKASQVPT